MRIWLDEPYSNAAVVDVCVVGAGAAGMAAARAAALNGAQVVLVEREEYLGGILPQCIHDGFGVFSQKESLTGPAYAQVLKKELEACNVDVLLSCDAHTICLVPASEASVAAQVFARTKTPAAPAPTAKSNAANLVRVSLRGSSVGGAMSLYARQLVLATGCYERPLASLGIEGPRLAGVMTAGAAQRMVNIEGVLPGKDVVILGAGDIAAIVARRLTLVGAHVVAVVAAELTCLHRNYVQCFQEFNIPVLTPWTVVSVERDARVQAVCIAPLNDDATPNEARTVRLACDTLLLSAGLLPRTEILDALKDANARKDAKSEAAQGIDLQSFIQTAGNARTIHALVDTAFTEGVRVGRIAAYRALAMRGVTLPAQAQDNIFLPDVPEHNLQRGACLATENTSKEYTCYACPKGCQGICTTNKQGGVTYMGFACENFRSKESSCSS